MNSGFITIYWREMKRYLRFKSAIVSSLLQPVIWLSFFGLAMSSSFDRLGANLPPVAGVTPVNYMTFMAAGVIAMTVLTTNLFGGINLLFDKNWGLMREVLASPLPRHEIITGMCLSGVTKSWIQTTIILIFGILLGVGFFTGRSVLEIAAGIVGLFTFTGLFAIGFLCLAISIAIRMESPEGLQAITTLLTMPIFFVSNALYPIDAFPQFLKTLSGFNPLTHLTNGIRFFTIGDNFTAIGKHFIYTPADIAVSFGALLIFTGTMFVIAWVTVRKAVIT